MLEKFPDFFEELCTGKYQAVVCTINQIVMANGKLVLGGGIAREFRDNFPGIDREWGARISRDLMNKGNPTWGDLLILTHVDEIPKNKYSHLFQWYVGLPTKRDFKDDSPEELVIKSCKGLKYIADSLGWENVLLTRPGCGLGGLEWKNVKKKILFLDDRFTVMHNEVIT